MSEIWSDVWGILGLLFSVFVLFAYLSTLINVVLDLFRDEKLGGFAKVLWLIALIFVPLLTVLIYVVVRGRGMAQRNRQAAVPILAAPALASSPAEQIATAKRLLDEGVITASEFASLKDRALAS